MCVCLSEKSVDHLGDDKWCNFRFIQRRAEDDANSEHVADPSSKPCGYTNITAIYPEGNMKCATGAYLSHHQGADETRIYVEGSQTRSTDVPHTCLSEGITYFIHKLKTEAKMSPKSHDLCLEVK